MKQQEILLTRPVKVVQVFRNINVYTKAQKSFADRKDAVSWKSMASRSGYVQDGILYLPEHLLSSQDLKSIELITIEDDNHTPPQERDLRYDKRINDNYDEGMIHYFKHGVRIQFDLFEIKRNPHLELHLRNYNAIGLTIPQREAFKLCDLKAGAPVEIKINHKTDFSMSSRRGREFVEQAYIFDFLGDFNHIRLLTEQDLPFTKQVAEHRKLVDLLKSLW